MTSDERLFLLQLARASVDSAVRRAPPPEPDAIPPAAAALGAAFVTLRRNGALRGCIGQVEAVDPVWRSVREMAAAAALRDPRFPPVREDELARLSCDISLLSPMRRARLEEIAVGTHGLVVRHLGRSGLLLPQVPVEWRWTRDEFLRQTCLKAGLPHDAWRDPVAELLIFTAEIFGDPGREP